MFIYVIYHLIPCWFTAYVCIYHSYNSYVNTIRVFVCKARHKHVIIVYHTVSLLSTNDKVLTPTTAVAHRVNISILASWIVIHICHNKIRRALNSLMIWHVLTFIWGEFYKRYLSLTIILKFHSKLLGNNELMSHIPFRPMFSGGLSTLWELDEVTAAWWGGSG